MEKGVQDVPLVRQALRRNRTRQRRTAIGFLLLGLISGWATNDFFQNYAKTPPLTSSNAGGASADAQPLPSTTGPWNKYATPPAVSSSNASSRPVPSLKPNSELVQASDSCVVSPRPTNGAILSNHSVGPHELRIHNGTSDDAIVKLRNQQNRDVASIYVYAGGRAALAGVPDGAFEVLFATGKRYAEPCDRFLDDFDMWKFPGLQNFIKSREGNLVYTTVIEFTLHEVPSGNIDRRRISEEEWFKR